MTPDLIMRLAAVGVAVVFVAIAAFCVVKGRDGGCLGFILACTAFWLLYAAYTLPVVLP